MIDIKNIDLDDFIVRKLTKELEKDTTKTVYDLFEWKRVDVSLKDYKTGKMLYDEKDLEFPVHYSQNACDIIAQKYFKRANVPNDRGKEYSLKQVIHRMTKFWMEAGLDEGLLNEKNAKIFYDEVAFAMLSQYIAPNSPQWFNTGLKYYNTGEDSDGHFYYDIKERKVKMSEDKYSRTQASACFILSVEDKLLGDKSISEQFVTETRLFKHGSGTGTNFSNLRAKGERLSGGGTSSGVLSFLKPLDASAGAIKSGGTCLAPYQKVFTDKGAIEVKRLAESNEDFIVLSYDPPSNRYKAKKANAWLSGNKEVVRIHTDKGHFDVTFDHPIKLSSGEFVKAEDLREGMSLFAGTIYNDVGYVRVNLKDGHKGKERWHRMILEDVYGHDLSDKSVHHKDENKTNNCISNLEIMSQIEHAHIHSTGKVYDNKHIFQNMKFPKKGEDNPMHSNNFWKNEEKASQLSEKRSDLLKASGRANDMQRLSAYQKMLNTGYKLINNGYDIGTFDGYIKARYEFIGRISSISKVKQSIDKNFGSYEGFLRELKENNHRVVKVEKIGTMDVYDVGVICPTLDDKSPNTGHNFLIWSLDNESDYFGTGIVVANTRRSAKMVQLDVDHPEILDYITWKSEQEKIVKDLGKMGYDTSFDGVAYDTVSGQNGNNTVRVNDEFMKKAYHYVTTGEDSDFELKGRVDNNVNKTVKVSHLWNEICRCAWECADPATAYDETFNNWHTCPMGEDGQLWAKHNRINSTNPCGEYAFLDDTACNLASINILRFYDNKTKTFDVESYKHTILLGQIILEATIHWGQFPIEEVARKTHMFRTTGLGIANTASLHLLMGTPYDSEESRNVASALMSLMTGYSYFTSSLMAKKLGTFEKFNINKPYMMEVIRNHARVSGAKNDKLERLSYKPVKLNHSILSKVGFNNISSEVKDIWNSTVDLGELYGYRNAQVTVIAPTGTISFAMDCESTSIEPFFAHTIWKKLVGGGGMSIVNPLIPQVLENLGYKKEDIENITERILASEIENCNLLKPEHLPIFDTANKCGKGQRYIEPMGHVKMMASLTPMVSGAISKTVNLPKEATIEDVSNILLYGWKLGTKGITVYRDGCKATQPLNTTIEDAITQEVKFEDMKYNDLVNIAYELKKKTEKPLRSKPHGILEGHKHVAVLDGLKLQIKIFHYEGTNKIAEIYVTADKEGTLVKGLLDSLSKQTSKLLQYNAPIEDVIKSLKGQKYEPHGFVTEHPYIKYADSISDLLAKILEIEIGDYSSCQIKPEKQLINNASEIIIKPINEFKHDSKPTGERIYGKTCPTCGSTHMIKNGTCHLCQDCGATTGCS